MSVDAIVSFIHQEPGRTATQIAEALFGVDGYHQRVSSTLRLLHLAGQIERRGNGGPGDPFKYYPVRDKSDSGAKLFGSVAGLVNSLLWL